MAQNIDSEKAIKILSDVNQNSCFWIHNGSIVRNLYELIHNLESINDETFNYHVDKTKNDFANWIRDIIQDDKLSKDLNKAASRKAALKLVSKRISELEKIVYAKKAETEYKYEAKKPKKEAEPKKLEQPIEESQKPYTVEEIDLPEIEDLPMPKMPTLPKFEERKEFEIPEIPQPAAPGKIEMPEEDSIEKIKKDIMDETYRRIAFERLLNRLLFLIIGLIAGILIGVYFVK